MRNSFRYFNSSPEVIRFAVMLYIRYPLSLRQVEDLLFERGIDICHETVGFWWNRFGPMFAAEIRKRRVNHRLFSQWRWHLDEVFVRINGEMHYLWRAVDHEGEVLEVFATKRRDRRAALKFLKRWGGRPPSNGVISARKEHTLGAFDQRRRASMESVSIIGVDISKRSFQLHGATAEGKPVFRKKLSRGKFLSFLAKVPPCVVVMEACGGAHFWGRQIIALGHACKLIPPIYVKPFVKRQKNDANDAEGIVEAGQRPTMRFVAVKSEEMQADAMLFRTRELLVRQRTQTINSIRGQLAEFGVIAAQGVANITVLRQEVAEVKKMLPEQVVSMAELLFDQIAALNVKIIDIEKTIRARARAQEELRRLMTIPGIGPICAMAVNAFAPPMESFGCGRDFAAWVGLTPRQNATAGKERLGRITKMGQRDLRRLFVLGATVVLQHMRKLEDVDDPWLRRMIAEKPPKLVAVALANKMARMIWALSVKKENYRRPAAAVVVA